MTPEEWAKDFFTRAPGLRNSVYLAADFRKAIEAERERCAAIADAMGCEAVANAIRHPEQAG